MGGQHTNPIGCSKSSQRDIKNWATDHSVSLECQDNRFIGLPRNITARPREAGQSPWPLGRRFPWLSSIQKRIEEFRYTSLDLEKNYIVSLVHCQERQLNGHE